MFVIAVDHARNGLPTPAVRYSEEPHTAMQRRSEGVLGVKVLVARFAGQ